MVFGENLRIIFFKASLRKNTDPPLSNLRVINVKFFHDI